MTLAMAATKIRMQPSPLAWISILGIWTVVVPANFKLTQ